MMCSLKGFSSKVFNLTLNVSRVLMPCESDSFVIYLTSTREAALCEDTVSLWCHNHGNCACALTACMQHVTFHTRSLRALQLSPTDVRRVRWLVIINCCRRECKCEGRLSVSAGPQIGDLPQVYPTSRPMVAWIGSSPSPNSSCTWTLTSEQHWTWSCWEELSVTTVIPNRGHKSPSEAAAPHFFILMSHSSPGPQPSPSDPGQRRLRWGEWGCWISVKFNGELGRLGSYRSIAWQKSRLCYFLCPKINFMAEKM